jgi:hypothetical protein
MPAAALSSNSSASRMYRRTTLTERHRVGDPRPLRPVPRRWHNSKRAKSRQLRAVVDESFRHVLCSWVHHGPIATPECSLVCTRAERAGCTCCVGLRRCRGFRGGAHSGTVPDRPGIKPPGLGALGAPVESLVVGLIADGHVVDHGVYAVLLQPTHDLRASHPGALEVNEYAEQVVSVAHLLPGSARLEPAEPERSQLSAIERSQLLALSRSRGQRSTAACRAREQSACQCRSERRRPGSLDGIRADTQPRVGILTARRSKGCQNVRPGSRRPRVHPGLTRTYSSSTCASRKPTRQLPARSRREPEPRTRYVTRARCPLPLERW